MSNSKNMKSILFPNTDQPYQVTDSRIPTDPGAYKYMATDGSGNWVAEDRLAYEETTEIVVSTEESEVYLQPDEGYDVAYVPYTNHIDIEAVVGLRLECDGEVYTEEITPDDQAGPYGVNILAPAGDNGGSVTFYLDIDYLEVSSTEASAVKPFTLTAICQSVHPFPENLLPAGEEWTFTLEDGSTVTKNVVVKA